MSYTLVSFLIHAACQHKNMHILLCSLVLILYFDSTKTNHSLIVLILTWQKRMGLGDIFSLISEAASNDENLYTMLLPFDREWYPTQLHNNTDTWEKHTHICNKRKKFKIICFRAGICLYFHERLCLLMYCKLNTHKNVT